MVLIIGRGSEQDRQSFPVYTRRVRRIPNERRQEQNPQRLRAAFEMFSKRLSVRLRSATGVYSCVGLVFASRRTWIDIDHVDWILTEDEYVRIEDQTKIVPGDLILYRNSRGEPTHIGVLIRRKEDIEAAGFKMTILSQWGSDGEYTHDINDVPELLGYPSEFYSERKGLN